MKLITKELEKKIPAWKRSRMKVVDRETISGHFDWIRFVIKSVTRSHGRKMHFMDYNEKNIDFAINEIEKALHSLKKLRN
jgi:hypothetical protein